MLVFDPQIVSFLFWDMMLQGYNRIFITNVFKLKKKVNCIKILLIFLFRVLI